jgi:hypothetical protein
MNNTTLIMVAVIMTAAFMVTALVWQQQQTQALTEAESSSTTCINEHRCHTSVSNPSMPYSQNSDHNRLIISAKCINDNPCHTSVSNSTKNSTSAWNSRQSLSENYPPIEDDITDLNDDTTNDDITN